MQMPFHNSYNDNQRFRPPNSFQWRPNFTPRGPVPRFRRPAPHWRQPSPQDHANEFWCETCDRGFRTSDILEKHKQQHQKCNIDGCQFIAHPKVITKHIQMQHASGLYKNIAKLQDPEEIKKWREERKNKYPTKENVEKAAAAMKEKIERGEKMGLKNNRHEKNNKTNSGTDKGKRKHIDKRNPRTSYHNNQNLAPDSKRRKTNPRITVKNLPVAEDTRKLKPFAGIQELMMDTEEQQDEPECSFTIEDDDEVEEAVVPSEEPSAPVCLALSSLMCNYGSSDEDEEQNNVTPIISNTPVASSPKAQSDKKISSQEADRIQNPTVKSVEKPITGNESDNDSGPEEVKVTKPVINGTEPTEIKRIFNKRRPRDNIKQKPINRRPKPKVPSTLLQKLLFKEIKHERNIVLQCIRHIVKNNFFDKSVSM